MKLLLDHGACPKQMEVGNVTPLMAAAGADLNLRSLPGAGTRGPTSGRTAVEGAAAWGWNEVVAALIELGARPPPAKPAAPGAGR